MTGNFRLFWDGEKEANFRVMFWLGALVWGLFSLINLLVNGIILDQVIIPAQIISGLVSYPPGHPHQVFYTQAFNLPNLLSAGILKIFPDIYFVSAIRNFIFLFLSTFIPFAFTLIITRRPYWGHLAAVLSFLGTTVMFSGVYPLWVRPYFYSDGHIGLYFSLFIAALFMAGEWSIGGLLLGLFPSVHLAMGFLIWPWSLFYIFLQWKSVASRQKVRLFAGLGSGILITLLTAGFFIFIPEVPPQIPYLSQLDGEIIRRNFQITTDGHRQLFPIFSKGYLLNFAAFFSIGGLLLKNNLLGSEWRDRGNKNWLASDVGAILLLGGMAWMIVIGARIIHETFGELPVILDIPMPYRFSNYSAVLLLPLTIGFIGKLFDQMKDESKTVMKVLLVGTLMFCWINVYTWPERTTHYTILILWGILCSGEYFLALDGRKSKLPAVGLFLILILATMFSVKTPKSVLALLASGLLSLFLLFCSRWLAAKSKIQWFRLNQILRKILLLSCIVLPLSALPNIYNEKWLPQYERWFIVTDFDRKLDEWLKDEGHPGEMILSSIIPRMELQVKTGHPVLFEVETIWLMTYMPDLAPTIGGMVEELYGIDYTDLIQIKDICSRATTVVLCPENHLSPYSSVWLLAWMRRSTEEWQLLSHKYGFRLVVAPTVTPLNLPVVFSSEGKSLVDGLTLYEIPPE